MALVKVQDKTLFLTAVQYEDEGKVINRITYDVLTLHSGKQSLKVYAKINTTEEMLLMGTFKYIESAITSGMNLFSLNALLHEMQKAGLRIENNFKTTNAKEIEGTYVRVENTELRIPITFAYISDEEFDIISDIKTAHYGVVSTYHIKGLQVPLSITTVRDVTMFNLTDEKKNNSLRVRNGLIDLFVSESQKGYVDMDVILNHPILTGIKELNDIYPSLGEL